MSASVPPLSTTATSLFAPGTGEAFLDRAIETARSHDVPLIARPSNLVSVAWDDASYADLVLLCGRAKTALGLWAAPVLPTTGPLRRLGFPRGANPIRLKQYFLELDGTPAHPDQTSADHWLSGLSSAVDTLWRGARADEPGLSLVSILRHTVRQSEAWGRKPEGTPPYGQMVRSEATSLLVVLQAAARIHQDGLMSEDTEAARPEAIQAARSVVLHVFERHARREVFPVPSVTTTDLLMVAERPVARGLALTTALASVVVPDVTRETRRRTGR